MKKLLATLWLGMALLCGSMTAMAQPATPAAAPAATAAAAPAAAPA
ncbi:MAG: heme-binding protein, partial [Betaproteobacteria bacterium]|nr:heme-binding protein [Betaproteobacteria bacterium]